MATSSVINYFPGYDGRKFVLVRQVDNHPINLGSSHQWDSETVWLRKAQAPHKIGSTGRIVVETFSGLQREFFPNVLGLKFVDADEAYKPPQPAARTILPIDDLRHIQVLLDGLILRTPSGVLRNILCDANIRLNAAQCEMLEPGSMANYGKENSQ